MTTTATSSNGGGAATTKTAAAGTRWPPWSVASATTIIVGGGAAITISTSLCLLVLGKDNPASASTGAAAVEIGIVLLLPITRCPRSSIATTAASSSRITGVGVAVGNRSHTCASTTTRADEAAWWRF